jgi:arginine-tRNA-protein transferase
MERKVFTHLVGAHARELNDTLSNGGFRRSQTIAYRPACETCRACVSIRIPVDRFVWKRSFRRVMATNHDLISTASSPTPTSEQYSLFRDYLDERHADGGMADMTVLDYAMMVEDTHVETQMVEYRVRQPLELQGQPSAGPLLGVSLTDRLSDGLSMVYSFYTPHEARRSLGTLMILDHIRLAASLGLPDLYLGYWVEGSPKMQYKTKFLPQQRLSANGWQEIK